METLVLLSLRGFLMGVNSKEYKKLGGRLGHGLWRCEVLWGNKSCICVHPMVKQSLLFSENGGIYLTFSMGTHMHSCHTELVNKL